MTLGLEVAPEQSVGVLEVLRGVLLELSGVLWLLDGVLVPEGVMELEGVRVELLVLGLLEDASSVES